MFSKASAFNQNILCPTKYTFGVNSIQQVEFLPIAWRDDVDHSKMFRDSSDDDDDDDDDSMLLTMDDDDDDDSRLLSSDDDDSSELFTDDET
jgi:hypothetical protein